MPVTLLRVKLPSLKIFNRTAERNVGGGWDCFCRNCSDQRAKAGNIPPGKYLYEKNGDWQRAPQRCLCPLFAALGMKGKFGDYEAMPSMVGREFVWKNVSPQTLEYSFKNQ
ncbi:MAG TPA: hypothetical protein PK745_02950 [bacterium]|nr:hypothetical protein [bacterium]